MKLKLIPAGEFEMGSDAYDPDASDNEKVNGNKHRVRITRPFYLGTTEVTIGQFRQFVEKSGYKTDAEKDGKGGYGWNEAKKSFDQDPKYNWRSPGFPQSDNHPVTNVSWNDAVAFCNWLSESEGKVPSYLADGGLLPDCAGYRLPTEAEWEYACRAGPGGTGAYSFGDASQIGRYAWYDGNSENKTHPVGQKLSNSFGLYDMHGNVWEWCADWYDSDYYKKSPPNDPLNSSGAAYRVFRGGSWFNGPRDGRSALRGRLSPVYRINGFLGFRVARVWSGL